MRSRSVILFADTIPSEQVLIPLLQVFDQIVYSRAAENDPLPTQLSSPLIEQMLADSRCLMDVPAPLGEDHERFMQLIADIRDRRDDYAVQFSHASLAALSRTGSSKRETKSSIISDLLSRKGIDETGADKKTMMLWQARLVLKLGEIFDADQEGLRRDLGRLESREESLIDELRKEQGSPFSLTRQFSAVSSAADDLQRLRLKAWARIFTSGNEELSAQPVFVSRNNDGVGFLADVFERMTGEFPKLVGSLSLPTRFSDSSAFMEQTRRFREKGDVLIEKFVHSPGGTQEVSKDFDVGSWNALVEQFYPGNKCGRSRLDMYYCPGVAPGSVFDSAFSPDSRTSPVLTAGAGFFLGALEEA